MKIVINIPEEDYKFIKDLRSLTLGRGSYKTIQYHIINAIKFGTILPKGHGRLMDADALKEEVNKKKVVGRFNTLLLIDNATTIIEADKE